MSVAYKAPGGRWAALSRVSVPGPDASAGGTAVRRKNRTTRRWPVVLFFSEGFLCRSAALLDFLTRFWIKILDFLHRALPWAPQASLLWQVSGRVLVVGTDFGFLEAMKVSTTCSWRWCRPLRIAAERPRGWWLFKGISNRAISSQICAPHGGCQSTPGAGRGIYSTWTPPQFRLGWLTEATPHWGSYFGKQQLQESFWWSNYKVSVWEVFLWGVHKVWPGGQLWPLSWICAKF